MQLTVEGYNPAKKDGINAKVWECLRRNRRFRKDIAEYRMRMATTGVLLDFNAAFVDAIRMNPFVTPVWLVLIGHKEIATVENLPWSALSKDIQGAFASSMDDILPRVKCLLPPPIDLIGKLTTEKEREVAYSWLLTNHFVWERSDVVAIPKFIRDTDHKKEIKKWLNDFVDATHGKVLNALKFRDDLPSGGKLLGTPRDWELVLFIEAQRNRGFTMREAFFLCACQLSDEREEVQGWSMKYLRSAMAKKNLRQIWGTYRSKLKRQLAAIRSGIRGIYPACTIFQG